MDANMNALARAPYDLIAEQWIRARIILEREKPYIDDFAALLTPGAHVLDLGCGAGIISRCVLDRGCAVTGVDASAIQLRSARALCPEAEFIMADMLDLELTTRYQGLVAWDSVFHIPRARHRELFFSMHRWLEEGAPVLLSLGGTEDEFTAPTFGVDFFYSGYAPQTSVDLVTQAGFEIIRAEIDDPSSRGHLAILCRTLATP
jgi:cyclopropane fatty-acyl-phospholipid synthase-like methyltransferase